LGVQSKRSINARSNRSRSIVARYGSPMKIGRLEHLASRSSRSVDSSLHFSRLSRFPRHASLVDCTSLVVHPSLSVLHIHTLVTRYSLLNGGIITSKWYLWICVTNINLRKVNLLHGKSHRFSRSFIPDFRAWLRSTPKIRNEK